MVNEGRGKLLKRVDKKYLIYLPKDLVEDSMFPFKSKHSVNVKVSFNPNGNKLLIEKWVESEES